MDTELSEFARSSSKEIESSITTRLDLTKKFKKLGLKSRDTVMVHASLKQLGYLVNGPNDIIDAVFDCIGKEGTMVVSANTNQNTDPAEWKMPPVPRKWIPIIRKHMRPFDPRTTLIRGRGLMPIAFMMYPNVYRSNHSVRSIAAKGRLAKKITAQHHFDESEGIGSPMHKLYLSKGKVLLVGVDLTRCTVVHLAEFMADVPYLYQPGYKCLSSKSKRNRFVRMRKYPSPSQYYVKLQDTLISNKFMRKEFLGSCPIMLMDIFPSVNYIVEQLKKDNRYLLKP